MKYVNAAAPLTAVCRPWWMVRNGTTATSAAHARLTISRTMPRRSVPTAGVSIRVDLSKRKHSNAWTCRVDKVYGVGPQRQGKNDCAHRVGRVSVERSSDHDRQNVGRGRPEPCRREDADERVLDEPTAGGPQSP